MKKKTHLPTTLYRDRQTGAVCEERLFAASSLALLYGDSALSRTFGRCCSYLAARSPLLSQAVGYWYRRPASRRLIRPFIDTFALDSNEFAEVPESYSSFDAFFTRRLTTHARPMASGDNVAVMPADGRYLFYPDVSAVDGWIIKGQKFDLAQLVGDAALAERYTRGTMVIARLCPADYHRFHFPCRCLPGHTRLLNGYWHSVHPVALRHNVHILAQNKRYLTELQTEAFGKVVYLEIGAFGVGSVAQTYQSDSWQEKGAEKGYFHFGASCVVMLFEPGALALDNDLTHGPLHMEVRCLMGQSLGRAP